MIKISTTLLALVMSLTVHAQTNPRIDAHQNAVDALSKLNFFADGRGMHLAPDFVNVYSFFGKIIGLPDLDTETAKKNPLSSFAGRWGVIIHDGEMKGFYNEKYKGMDVAAAGCIACHSGKVAGRYYIGLGNKNIDIGQLATDVNRAQKIWKKVTVLKRKSKAYKEIEKGALEFAGRLSDDRYNNITQGLVPVSMIRQWFYRVVEGKPLPENEPRGQIKVPHFWGYGKKRFIGQFSDGYGDGAHAGWGLAVELAGTQTPETIRKIIPKVEHAENLLHDILPPKYPFKINQVAATRGKTLFDKTCARCHGTYERDEAGLPIYKEPKHIAIGRIKTDDDRLKGNTPHFADLVDRNPVSEYIRRSGLPNGYFAPRLEAVWARFPYLHNGSVPSMMALLTRPEDRPIVWSLKDAGEEHRYNQTTMGYTLPKAGSKELKALLKHGKKGDRDIYDTRRVGQSAIGHWFKFAERFSHKDKIHLIEYLKTI